MNKIIKAILVMILTSVPVIAGCSPTPTPTPQPADGEELSSYQLQVDLLGEKNEFFIDSQGALKSKVEISSADGRISLSADKGTTSLDKDGKPLQIIYAVIDPSPPPPPEDASIVGTAYDLEPQGATFDPWLLLTLSYDPEELPEGVTENDLYIAYHNGTEWRKLAYKRVDTNVHSVTTQVSHFTTFAILGTKKPASSTTPTPTQGTQVGNLAPDFQLLNLDGKPVSLSDLQGKPVILNFWATWCRPCVSEMPYIQEIYEEWSGKGLMLLTINLGESSSKVEKFLQSNNLSLPVLLDAKQDVALKYSIQYIPTTFFIDKDGIIQAKKIGSFLNKQEIETNLNKIMP